MNIKMKLPLTILAVFYLSASGLLAEKRISADDYFRQGEAALEVGEIEKARTAYMQALRINPKHGNARYRLVSLKSLSADIKLKMRKKQLAAISIPEITFEDIPLNEALEGLGVLIEKASENNFVPNFVLDDPTGLISNRSVSLRLKSVPANVALQYLLSQAAAREVWSEHVITIRPQGRRSSAAPEPIADPKPKADPFKRPLQRKK